MPLSSHPRRLTPLRALASAALALCAATCLTRDYSIVAALGEGDSLMSTYAPLSVAVLFGLLYVAFLRAVCSERRVSGVLLAASALFGCCSLCGLSLYHFDTTRALTANAFQSALSCVCLVGWCALYDLAGFFLFDLLDAGRLTRGVSARPAGKLVRFFDAHTLLCSFLLLLLCWLPWQIAFFPGTQQYDTLTQLSYSIGKFPWLDHHPVFSSWLMGRLLALGRAFGSDNLGMYFYILLQTLLGAYAFSAMAACLKRLGCRPAVQICVVLLFGLLPAWPMYLCIMVKNTLSTIVFVLFLLELVRLLYPESRVRPLRWYDYARSGAVALLLCLLIKSGLYVVLAAALALAGSLLFNRRRPVEERGGKRRGLAALMAAFALFVAFESLLPTLGVRSGTVNEALCLPFQQTARYLRDHGDDVTSEERAAISAVMQYDKAAQAYTPCFADPVKDLTVPTSSLSDMRQYLRAWAQMGLRHPVCYFNAFAALNYGYYAFTPPINHYAVGMGFSFTLDIPSVLKLTEPFSFSHNPALAGARRLLSLLAVEWEHIPVLNLLYCCAFYTAVTSLLVCYFLHKRQWRGALLAIVPLTVLLTCLVSPVNQLWRYFMPVAAAVPLLLGCAVASAGEAARSE